MDVPEILIAKGFGKRQLLFEDFEDVCSASDFRYFFTTEDIGDGLTYPRIRHGKKYRVIVLKQTLFRNELLETAWHEFTHAFYEHYGVQCFIKGSTSKYERIANDLALCCLIPTVWCETKSRNELLEEGFTEEQLERRKEIYDNFGI